MNRQPYSGHSIDIEMVTETAALLLFLLLKMNISDRGGKNMKSKIVRGIINGGVLAAVAALGIISLEQSPSQKIPRRKILYR